MICLFLYFILLYIYIYIYRRKSTTRFRRRNISSVAELLGPPFFILFHVFSWFFIVDFFYIFLIFSYRFLAIPEPPDCSPILCIACFFHVFHVSKKSLFSSLLYYQKEAQSSKIDDFRAPKSMNFSAFSYLRIYQNTSVYLSQSDIMRVPLFAGVFEKS